MAWTPPIGRDASCADLSGEWALHSTEGWRELIAAEEQSWVMRAGLEIAGLVERVRIEHRGDVLLLHEGSFGMSQERSDMIPVEGNPTLSGRPGGSSVRVSTWQNGAWITRVDDPASPNLWTVRRRFVGTLLQFCMFRQPRETMELDPQPVCTLYYKNVDPLYPGPFAGATPPSNRAVIQRERRERREERERRRAERREQELKKLAADMERQEEEREEGEEAAGEKKKQGGGDDDVGVVAANGASSNSAGDDDAAEFIRAALTANDENGNVSLALSHSEMPPPSPPPPKMKTSNKQNDSAPQPPTSVILGEIEEITPLGGLRSDWSRGSASPVSSTSTSVVDFPLSYSSQPSSVTPATPPRAHEAAHGKQQQALVDAAQSSLLQSPPPPRSGSRPNFSGSWNNFETTGFEEMLELEGVAAAVKAHVVTGAENGTVVIAHAVDALELRQFSSVCVERVGERIERAGSGGEVESRAAHWDGPSWVVTVSRTMDKYDWVQRRTFEGDDGKELVFRFFKKDRETGAVDEHPVCVRRFRNADADYAGPHATPAASLAETAASEGAAAARGIALNSNNLLASTSGGAGGRPDFSGEWVEESATGMDEYLMVEGVPWVTRKAMAAFAASSSAARISVRQDASGIELQRVNGAAMVGSGVVGRKGSVGGSGSGNNGAGAGSGGGAGGGSVSTTGGVAVIKEDFSGRAVSFPMPSDATKTETRTTRWEGDVLVTEQQLGSDAKHTWVIKRSFNTKTRTSFVESYHLKAEGAEAEAEQPTRVTVFRRVGAPPAATVGAAGDAGGLSDAGSGAEDADAEGGGDHDEDSDANGSGGAFGFGGGLGGGGSSSGGGGASGVRVQEEVFENERYIPGLGWGAPSLYGDPHRYSTRDFSKSAAKFPQCTLNAGWAWEDEEWRVDLDALAIGAVDKEGWTYASVNFDNLNVDAPRPGSGTPVVTDIVRRRRWYRRLVATADNAAPSAIGGGGGSSTAGADGELASKGSLSSGGGGGAGQTWLVRGKLLARLMHLKVEVSVPFIACAVFAWMIALLCGPYSFVLNSFAATIASNNK